MTTCNLLLIIINKFSSHFYCRLLYWVIDDSCIRLVCLIGRKQIECVSLLCLFSIILFQSTFKVVLTKQTKQKCALQAVAGVLFLRMKFRIGTSCLKKNKSQYMKSFFSFKKKDERIKLHMRHMQFEIVIRKVLLISTAW